VVAGRAALAFTSRRTGMARTVVRDLETGHEESFDDFPGPVHIQDWTADGRTILVRSPSEFVINTSPGIYAVGGHGARSWRKLVDLPGSEDQMQVSPDGRWVAYNSNVTGDWEIHVARFPDFSDRQQVSTGGGMQPRWRQDGRELFSLAPDASLIAVPFDATRTPRAPAPRPLFRTWLHPSPKLWQYDVARDGRFLVLEQESGTEVLTVLLDWSGRSGS
jgi:eukaryotic-like serine/threonine-protein kinase